MKAEVNGCGGSESKSETLWLLRRKKNLRLIDRQPPFKSRARLIFFVCCLFVLCLSSLASAQPPDEMPDDIVPPPLKQLSKDEKRALEVEQNIKKRTQTALFLMDARLKNAETQTGESDYNTALETLAGFHALLDNTLEFLLKNDVEKGKVQVNFKRFELALRAYTPRLEVIRRAMPVRYGYHVRGLLKAVRAARSKAIEPLFDDTVVPETKKP